MLIAVAIVFFLSVAVAGVKACHCGEKEYMEELGKSLLLYTGLLMVLFSAGVGEYEITLILSAVGVLDVLINRYKSITSGI